jgi:pre-mRNA-splicing factor 38B
MKLTKNQMQTLISHQDSPFIRCVALLYLRYLGKFDQLYDWFEPLLEDEETFAPDRDTPTKLKTVAQYAKELLTTMRYKDTLFPRIPIPIEKVILAKLAGKSTEDSNVPSVLKTPPPLAVGTLCRAKYWEDGKWYDGRIEEPGSKPDTYWVTFLPEDEYGNQEEVPLGDIQLGESLEEKKATEAKEPRQQEEDKNHSDAISKRIRVDDGSFGETDEQGLTKYDDL